jgi:hypothetical protein
MFGKHSSTLFMVWVVALIVATQTYSPTYTGQQWQSNTAQEKQTILNGQIYANNVSSTWYSAVETTGILLEDMNTTFDFVGDDMPAQYLIMERPKLIHSVGVIAPIQYTPQPGSTPYTGFFQGTNTAYVRLSLAGPPTTDPPLIIPGLSLKFLREGVGSASIMAMFSIQGQVSFNYFEHDLTNHPPYPDPNNISDAQYLLFEHFKDASDFPNYLGVSALAEYDQQGNYYANASFPFRLVFHPVDAVHELFPSAPQSGDYFFLPQLESIPAGPLFQVYAQSTPAADFELIGTLTTLTPLSGSNYADLNLFFEHTRMENDFAYHPEWIDPTNKLNEQQMAIPYYTWPDLPWNSTATSSSS